MNNLLFIISCFLIVGCNTPYSVEYDAEIDSTRVTPHFTIKDSAELRIIEVVEPYLMANKTERYVLYQKSQGKPTGVHGTVFIGLPIQKIGINSTTHFGFLNALQQQDKIAAVSNKELFYDEKFKSFIVEEKITELGTRTLNTEVVIDCQLDVLFSFAIDASSFEQAQRLRSLGQPVVLISEFMESEPLKKAKWLEVFAAFFDDSVVNKSKEHLEFVTKEYESIKKESMLYSSLPKVAIGLPWKGTWYVSGSSSFQAQLIRDAAASYCWQQYDQTASIPLDIETAVSESMQADVWINTGVVTKEEGLVRENEIFKQFKSFNNKNIYTNYKRSNALGANDYWETGVVRPDLILRDLVTIFHNTGDSLIFYKSIFE